MLGFISFSIKIILASVIGGAINYIPEKQENGENIFNTALICIFSTAILAITKQLSSVGDNFLMGFGIISVFMTIIFIKLKFHPMNILLRNIYIYIYIYIYI